MKRGFTLVEILTVIAIIGILSAIVLTQTNEARKSARDAVRIRDAQIIAKSVDAYYVEHNTYPPLSNGLYASSLDSADWDTFLKNTLGFDNVLHAPKEGSNLDGVGNLDPSVDEALKRYRRYSYFYVDKFTLFAAGDEQRLVEGPTVYFPLEKKVIPCDASEEPVGCTPQCLQEDGTPTSVIVGPLDAVNCYDLKTGCTTASSQIGGSNAWGCISTGPL